MKAPHWKDVKFSHPSHPLEWGHTSLSDIPDIKADGTGALSECMFTNRNRASGSL